jgi:hypothetical protein
MVSVRHHSTNRHRHTLSDTVQACEALKRTSKLEVWKAPLQTARDILEQTHDIAVFVMLLDKGKEANSSCTLPQTAILHVCLSTIFRASYSLCAPREDKRDRSRAGLASNWRCLDVV